MLSQPRDFQRTLAAHTNAELSGCKIAGVLGLRALRLWGLREFGLRVGEWGLGFEFWRSRGVGFLKHGLGFRALGFPGRAV